jgi:hypothetical protein
VDPVRGPESFQAVALDDIDGDGRIDAVFAARSSIHSEEREHNVWCRNAGDGDWDCRSFEDYGYQRQSGAQTATSAVGTGDFNNDGNVDVVFAGSASRTENTLWRAEVCLGGFGPKSEFTCRLLPDVEIVPDGGPDIGVNDLAVGDLDQDGNLDVVLAGWMQVHEVCFGLGDLEGRFNCVQIESERGGTFMDVTVGDLDGDGAPDILFASAQTPSRWCRGLGNRQFACENIGEAGASDKAIAIADLDGDGTQDVVFGREGDQPGVDVCFGPLTFGVPCERESIVQRISVQGDVLAKDITGDGVTDLLALWAPGMTACLGQGAADLSCRDLPMELLTGGFLSEPTDAAFLDFDWVPNE